MSIVFGIWLKLTAKCTEKHWYDLPTYTVIPIKTYVIYLNILLIIFNI